VPKRITETSDDPEQDVTREEATATRTVTRPESMEERSAKHCGIDHVITTKIKSTLVQKLSIFPAPVPGCEKGNAQGRKSEMQDGNPPLNPLASTRLH
jgi:hypothetical protein